MTWPPEDTGYCRWTPTTASWLSIVHSVVGLGAGDTPAGRRQAYLDLIAPIEATNLRASMAAMSGCALVARGLLRCHGVDAEHLRRPYVVGHAVSDIVAIAKWTSAWEGADARPEVGDIILIGKAPSPNEGPDEKGARIHAWGGGEHVLVVTDLQGYSISTVEGGQTDYGGQCILAKTRSLYVINRTVWLGSRRVAGLVRMAKVGNPLPRYAISRQ